MIEESDMDRTGSTASGCKGSAASGDKGKEKKFNKGKKKDGNSGYYREPVKSTDVSHGSGRKPAPQKSREGYDKRPRARGNFEKDGPNAKGRSEVAKEYQQIEFSSVQQGSKKHNLNHLLNFTIAPRDGGEYNSRGRGGRGGAGYRGGRQKWGPPRVKYNKEQFLQANCQFLVRDTDEYVVHSGDPDVLVDWDLIEQIRIFGHEVPSCPICLYPPTAAKMTRCGHVYCWSCILHYLSLTDKTWRKCPICHEAIHQPDLKSVVAMQTTKYALGGEITLKLMRRGRGSVVAMPVSQWRETEGKLFGVDDQVDTQFMKLLAVSQQEVLDTIISVERTALETQYELEKDCPESCFIQQALELLNDRAAVVPKAKKKLPFLPVGMSLDDLEVEEGPDDVVTSSQMAAESQPNIVYSSAFDDEVVSSDETAAVSFSVGDDGENVVQMPPGGDEGNDAAAAAEQDQAKSEDGPPVPEEFDCELRQDVIPIHGSTEEIPVVPSALCLGALAGDEVDDREEPSAERRDQMIQAVREAPKRDRLPKDTFYFYQAADGQHVYIHPLNVRCLVKEYGSLEFGPEVLTAKIVELDGFSMTEEVRNRVKYLQHLPLTCEFQLVEVELKPPIVGRKTLDFFRDEIHKRKQQRQRKARDENRWEKQVRSREGMMRGQYPSAKLTLESRREFPEYNAISSDLSPPLVNQLKEESGLEADADTGSPSSIAGSSSFPPSFAQMLKVGEPKVEVWPRAKKPSGSGSDGQSTGVASSDKMADSDEEDRAAPVFNQSFGDALADAFEKLNTDKSGEGRQESAPSSGGKKKKGKKKQLTLFSTSMARSGK